MSQKYVMKNTAKRHIYLFSSLALILVEWALEYDISYIYELLEAVPLVGENF